ncbi:DUF4350 domain-containing protein [Streptomyces rubellomurinus]|uniref:DUF4350 domain-containing protein n=2 Tax=Streptomyces TaxID=1883 RepID=A0A0F2TEV6_STRR3|nr:DUF4350 domain-containing protein [Streptomyces rubellomurinus]KJS54755.1 hypothetical protein VM98_17155 [Streptomyces rubellomurinus subsp. indigoferus]KJS61738.1 hypothetical protein VM95_12840 [Streptomyces rubellomurinus]
MTSTVPAPAPPAAEQPTRTAPTSLAPTGRGLLRRARWYLAFLAVLLIGAVTVVALGRDREYPTIDPRSYDRDGAHAAYALLEQQGLATRLTTDPTAHPAGPDTLVLPEPDLLTPDQLRAIAAARHTRLVLIAPGPTALSALAPGIRSSEEDGGLPYAPVRPANAGCSLPEAVRAGDAETGGMLYTSGSRGEGCYPRGHGYALVRTPLDDGTRDVVVLGSGVFLQNGELTVAGNASLALGLLGSQPALTWHLPDYSVPLPKAAHPKTFGDFVPDGWHWALRQLAVAAVLAALWRGRRLGPVVSENLPVVVRASETTEGRARLYRRAKAHGRAAQALRRAAAHRLAPALGVPLRAGAPDPDALCAALADRHPEQSAGDVRALLYGPPPTDDAALLRLADDLDALERQVRNP